MLAPQPPAGTGVGPVTGGGEPRHRDTPPAPVLLPLQSKTLASEMSLTAAASTMFLMTNFLMALSLGTQRAQLVHRMGWTWPRPFLARPLFLLFLVCKGRGRDGARSPRPPESPPTPHSAPTAPFCPPTPYFPRPHRDP